MFRRVSRILSGTSKRQREYGTGVEAKRVEGGLVASGLRIAVVASRWNDFIVSRLIGGAVDAIERHGGSAADVTIYRVPGSFEIPLATKRVALSNHWDAIVCLGAVIRGETPHFDYVAGEAFKGIASVSLETGVPIAVGIVTAYTLDQAIDRAGAKSGNKGFEAAVTAIEMASLLRSIEK
jgi:6,7-dimethyl-8-ribityllumazine synthase